MTQNICYIGLKFGGFSCSNAIMMTFWLRQAKWTRRQGAWVAQRKWWWTGVRQWRWSRKAPKNSESIFVRLPTTGHQSKTEGDSRCPESKKSM